jgi:glucose/arabinose dehydrogenase
MSNGAHTLQLATLITRDGETLESERSAPLSVVVAGSSSIGVNATPSAGAIVGTAQSADSRAAEPREGSRDGVVGELERPNDLAIAPDGRVFIAEGSGRISIVTGGRRRTALEPGRETRVEVLAIALDPQVARNGLVYVIRAALDNAPPVLQLVRYREVGGALGEAATLLDDIPASNERPAAALRFGPDGRLYAAFEEGSDASPAQGAYNGKILRLNPDGTTPRDQPGATPVFAAGARRPRGITWDANGVLWIVEGDPTRPERLIAAAPRGEPSYTLPVPFGAASAVFDAAGDLLIGAETAAYILRVRFDEKDRQRVVGTEHLLEGEVDAIRALAVAPDGTVYVCTSTTLIDRASLRRAGKTPTPR